MSLAEVAPYESESRGPDRTPPQDMGAEQCVLGAMLMSKDAIADVIEQIRGNDFYRPAHELIFEAVIDLYGRGEPADAITVAAELTKRGEIGRIGGHTYLHDLLASVPVAANAGYYAEIVREKAILRRLVEASIKIAQMGYSGQGDVDDIVDSAQQEVYQVTDRRSSEDYKPLSDLMEATLDEIEAIGSRGGQMAGVPTGFIELDELTNGLHGGQMIIVAARPAMGKALALDTPLPTPDGWTTMGEVAVGDRLIDADGKPTTVVAATEVMDDRPCYEITFSDGTTVVADALHEWKATNRAARRAPVGRKQSYHFPRAVIDHVVDLAVTSADTEDRLLTMSELVAEVGDDFRHVLHSVGREIGGAGREQRVASGDQRTYTWASPVYSRQAILMGLAQRVARPRGSAAAQSFASTVTTEEMAARVRLSDGRANWAVDVAAPVVGEEKSLPLAPYALGCWLGDGHSASARMVTVDDEIVSHLQACGLRVEAQSGLNYSLRWPETSRQQARLCDVCGEQFTPKQPWVRTCGRVCGGKVRDHDEPVTHTTCPDCGGPFAGGVRCAACHAEHGTVQAVLRTLGVLNDKHIPREYLRASVAQRRELLAGLLDTDGTVVASGSVQFVVTNERLARDTRELVVSLGYRCSIASKSVKGRSPESSVAYMVNFSPTDDVFKLARKRARHAQVRRAEPVSAGRRYITDIRKVDSVPVRCVEVDNPEHLYLATNAMIPTHNSTLGLDLARAASIKNGLCSAIFSLEMSQVEITMRLLSAEAQIPLNHIRKGTMTDEDWTRLAKKMGEVSEAPLFIDDSPNLTMMEIRAKARRLRQRHDLKLVIIDYMQLMTSGKKVESRQLEVSEFSRQLKLLAKELEVPVVAISQLNRGPEQRNDKKPMLSDLRESGSLEQDADMVILLSREDAYDKESPRLGEADFIVAKHRNGPTKTIVTAFQGHYSRFVDMQH